MTRSTKYKAIHEWLRRNFTKTGSCEQCNATGKTHWAFLRHPEQHTRERAHYRELCSSCHQRMDNAAKPPRRSTHCRKGHPYTPETERWTSAGQRQCRICLNAGDRARYHARRQLAS